jgi:hypothetical protein
MRKYLLPMLLGSALISGCQTTKPQNVCDGWQRLTPSLETSVAILKSDRPFANQVAAHNAFGRKSGCWK